MSRKYMVLCVAGQSNAVGYDESVIAQEYLAQFDGHRLFQLGFHGEDNLKILPLGACAQNYQDMRPFGHPDSCQLGTKGIHLPLSQQLLQGMVRRSRSESPVRFLVISSKPRRVKP